jgi:membrane protease subunit (stomatin/prohibitin family)
MALFGNKEKTNKGGLFADMIMSPEHDRNWLIYKWRPEGEEAGSTKRENSIRYSSSLTVRQGEVAVFQYSLKGGGGSQDYIEGFYSDQVKSANLPILAGIVGVAFGGGTPFPAQVYFINIAGANQVQFGVPYFPMFDPRLPDHPVDVAVRGAITFRIGDYKQFAGLYALVDFDMAKFQTQIKNSIIDHVQGSMMDIQVKLGRPLAQINAYRREIKGILQEDLSSSLLNTFGVILTELNISAIEIDRESEGYSRLAKLTKDMTETKIETQQELGIRGMQDTYAMQKEGLEAMQGINLENMAESNRINREEGQYAQHMQTDMGGFALHQLHQQEEIAKASTAAMGQMGQGAGVSMGGGAGGFNPGAMMAGMAMGGAVGQGMAGMMGNVFNQMGQQMPGQTPPPMPGAAPAAPPPLPLASSYSIAVNGQTYGPYDMNALSQMVSAGQFNAQSMVWCDGMAGWQAAGTVQELAPLFASSPLPPPPPPPAS